MPLTHPKQALQSTTSSMQKANIRQTQLVVSVVDHSQVNCLVKLSSLALIGKFCGSPKVEPAPNLDLCYNILDMNGADRLYSFNEDVGDFLEFCIKNFEVVF